jgi:ankyrin repeat protein
MRGIRSCQDTFFSCQKTQVPKSKLVGPAMRHSAVRRPEPCNFPPAEDKSKVEINKYADFMKGIAPFSPPPPSLAPTPSAQSTQVSSASTESDPTPSAGINLATNIDVGPKAGFNIPGWTIIHAACNNKNIDGVTAILAKGKIDPNIQTSNEGWTPLWVTACHGLLEISRLLIEAGANVNLANRKGITPLKEAAQIGAITLVQLLIENGANVDLAPSDFRDSPLIVASAKNHIDVVRILLAAGANIRAQQSSGWSPLHYALLNKNIDMANLILGHGPDINASTLPGLRPLHLAALAGFVEICARLLELGAEADAVESGNLTALRVAVQAGQFGAVKLLVENGARTDIVGTDGYNLIDVALMCGHLSVYQYFEGLGS